MAQWIRLTFRLTEDRTNNSRFIQVVGLQSGDGLGALRKVEPGLPKVPRALIANFGTPGWNDGNISPIVAPSSRISEAQPGARASVQLGEPVDL